MRCDALTLDLLQDFESLCGLDAEWLALAEEITDASPFQLPQWLLAWWRNFGSGKIQTFVFRRAGRLVGLVPCFLHSWNGYRQLTLIGTGISDYLEPLIQPGDSAEAVGLLSQHLADCHEWDVCDWQDLSGESRLLRLPAGGAVQVECHDDVECLRLPLAGNFEEYWSGRSADLRRNVRRYSRKAEQIGPVRFEVTADDSPRVVTSLLNMHTARWNRLGQPGMVNANGSAGFLQEIAGAFAKAGMLRLFTLWFQERMVAGLFTFVYGGRIYSYMSAFDLEYEEFGFGRTLLFHTLRYGFENRYLAFDFLRGIESYKLSWGPEVVPKRRIVLRRAC